MSKKKISKLIISMICIGVIIYGAINYMNDDKKYDEVIDSATENVTPDKKDKDDDGFRVNWSKLPKECNLWIRFKHPKKISYPVMQGEDNEYFLHRDIYEDYSYSGTIYLDYHNSIKLEDHNTIFYGHNMANGSMFGKLKNYAEKKYWNKRKYFYIYDRAGYRYKYLIWNIIQVKPVSKIYTYTFGTEEKMNEYIKKCQDEGMYGTGITPKSTDKLVLLSTCSLQGTRRLCLQGYLIEKRKLSNAAAEKNKSKFIK